MSVCWCFLAKTENRRVKYRPEVVLPPPMSDLASRLRAASGSPIVDTRPGSEYTTAHLAGSSSFPLTTIKERSGELPPPSANGTLYLLVAPGEASKSLQALERGRPAAPLDVFEATPTLWTTAAQLGLLETGDESRRESLSLPSLTAVSYCKARIGPFVTLAHVAHASECSHTIHSTRMNRAVFRALVAVATPLTSRGGARGAFFTSLTHRIFPHMPHSHSPHISLSILLLGGEAELPRESWRCVDFGCGKGRDAIYLARRSKSKKKRDEMEM